MFADPDFDGDPVMIKQVSEVDDLTGAEEEAAETPIIDIDGQEIDFDPNSYPQLTGGGEIVEEPKVKIRVDGVHVQIVNERVQYLGADGKIITILIRKKPLLMSSKVMECFLKPLKKKSEEILILLT